MEKDPLTHTVIGRAMKVYNTLGPGFQEVIYQRWYTMIRRHQVFEAEFAEFENFQNFL